MIMLCYNLYVSLWGSFVLKLVSHIRLSWKSQINPPRVQLVDICQQKQDGSSLLFQLNGAHCRKEGQILMYLQKNEQ